jgi:hypothetical protein
MLVLLHAWNEIDEVILANDARVACDFGIFSLSMASDFLRYGSIHVSERLWTQLRRGAARTCRRSDPLLPERRPYAPLLFALFKEQ